jgi:hypothetical protein
MFPLLGHRLLYGLHIRRAGHNPPRGPSADWWVLTTANAVRTNSLTCLPKHGGARDNKFLVTHPMADQRCLTSAIAHRSVLTAGPSSSSWDFWMSIIAWKLRTLVWLLNDILKWQLEKRNAFASSCVCFEVNTHYEKSYETENTTC